MSLEDIVDAGFHLPIGFTAHGMGIGRELIEYGVARALGRIVLVGKVAPETFHVDKLTPFEPSDERDTVEQACR